MRKALFIGGTGTISSSITRQLANSDNWEVFVLNRGKRKAPLPENVRQIIADINDAAAVEKALDGCYFDVVADFIAYNTADVKRDISLFAQKTNHYIFISSASAYQKPVLSLPITESTPLHNPYWEYSRNKIACEEMLISKYREMGFPVTIVRPSHTYNYTNYPTTIHGKGNSWQTLLRIREGKPIVIHGDGTSLWTLTHADDFAVGFIGLMGNPRTIGHAVHITSDDVLTWNQVYTLAAEAFGVELNPVHISSDAIARSNPDFLGTLLGDKSHSVYFDNSKLRHFVPWFAPRIRFTEAARRIIETMLANPVLQILDPEFDAWCDTIIGKCS